jgi:hypothetical protein
MEDSMVPLLITLVALVVSNLVVSSITLYKNKEDKKEGFTDINNKIINCLSPSNLNGSPNQYISGGASGMDYINFQGGREKIGDNCYCKPGLISGSTSYGGPYCLDKNGIISDFQYAAGNSVINNNILGKNGEKNDICSTDLDCSQIKINKDYSVEYLSNMRCDSSCPLGNGNSPPISGKCQDIYTLYGIQ